MIFSYSRLKLYEDCPYRFYLKYILKISEPTSLPLALGKAVHKAIECMIKGETFEKAVIEGWIESDFYPELCFEDISDLASRAKVYKDMGETEVKFVLPLSPNNPDSPIIQGYIDLVVGNGTSLTDWKTNRVMYEVTDNKQVALYAWALNQLYGTKSVIGTLYFLRFRKAKTKMFDELDMEFAKLWALNLANEINFKLAEYTADNSKAKELFQPKTSSYCTHCPFAVQCVREFCT